MKKVSIDLQLADTILLQLEENTELYDTFLEAVRAAKYPLCVIDTLINKMDKPIVFFDTETTGVNISTDKIITLDAMKLNLDGTVTNKTWLIHPGRSIPKEASEVHGIYDADVAACYTFDEYAEEIADFMEGCDLAHYNGDAFDIPLLAEEMNRADITFSMLGRISLDVSNIFRKKEGRKLTDALKFYTGLEHEGAHNSEADVEATYKVFLAQLKAYPDLAALSLAELAKETCFNPNAVDLAGKLSRNEKGEVVYNFGKHKDKPVTAEKDYANWMIESDFPSDTKEHLMNLIPALRRFSKNKAIKDCTM